MIVVSKINLDKYIKNDPPFKKKFNQLPYNEAPKSEGRKREVTAKHFTFYKIEKHHQRCSIKRGVLRNFTKFTGVFL